VILPLLLLFAVYQSVSVLSSINFISLNDRLKFEDTWKFTYNFSFYIHFVQVSKSGTWWPFFY